MSKSTLPKWVNPTGDNYWDGYYMLITPAFYGVLLLVFLILGAAIYNTLIS